jgi:hypothetical protein
MRGEIREGRFNINYDRNSFINGTTKELVNTVGTKVEWWFYDEHATTVDPIDDVGGSNYGVGGRIWKGPLTVPVVKASIVQGVTVQNDRGFYNTDILRLTLNVDLIEEDLSLLGANLSTIPQLRSLEINPDDYLRDRIVFRHEVFTPTRINPLGIVKNNYTLIAVDCNQVNPEEMVNDTQFQHYAGYNPFEPDTL